MARIAVPSLHRGGVARSAGVDWFADHDLASICRSQSGFNMPRADTPVSSIVGMGTAAATREVDERIAAVFAVV